MKFFTQVVRPGDRVIEVGGHVGYIALHLADLVGPRGRVEVFEPGADNLRYLRQNLHGMPHVTLVELAVSDSDGRARFFEEDLTGQNNTLVADYKVFSENCSRAYATAVYREREVDTIRLDTYVERDSTPPRLIKIDVEGAELLVLSGSIGMLTEHKPVLVVEVTKNGHEVTRLLEEAGYELRDVTGRLLSQGGQSSRNVFALHREVHAGLAASLGWPTRSAA